MIFLVWDRPFIFGLKANNIEVLRLDNGHFVNTQILPYEAKNLVRLNKGIVCASSASQLYCIVKSRKSFYCYNCGEENSHFSKNCIVLDQQFTRCPECEAVAKTPTGHRIRCTNSRFVSKKIGSYELPLMKSHRIRLTFKNIDQIFCAELTTDGLQNYLITKFLSVGTNIQLRRIYGSSQEVVIEMKYKPAITMSFGRLNDSKNMASLMFCEDQIRINHYQHINQQGTVTYNLSTQPRKDISHDINLKMKGQNNAIEVSLLWNSVQANITMTESTVTIQ